MEKANLNNGISEKDIIAETEKLFSSALSKNLSIIIETQEKLKDLKEKEIRFSEPVLKQNGNAIIFPHTINVIQGQAGVHKSRLAENICASFLKLPHCSNQLLGYERNDPNANTTVVYVDTERNLTEQLPYALQCIQVMAGFEKADHPVNFKYISLLQISRKERFEALNEYLNLVKEESSNPIFIVLDVSTDCIEDFNKTDKSMELIDLMNIAINEHNVIFLCLIHENPKSEKARGHFGTELMNKASTVMQVGFEKDGKQNDTEIIRVKYLKCRSTAKHLPFHIKYCDDAKSLVLAEPVDVNEVVNSRKQKASIEDVIDYLTLYLGDNKEMEKVILLEKLCKEFDASVRTIESRISQIISENSEVANEDGVLCSLNKEYRDKKVYYNLMPAAPF